MIKKILVPTDGSGHSHRAFLMAVDMGKQLDAEIILLNVAATPEALGYSLSMDAATALDKHNMSSEIAFIRTMEGANLDEISVKTRRATGYPAREILKEAIKEEIDLIIMGVHGYGLIAGSLMGSVSQKVLVKSEKPVLLIK